MAKSLKQIEAQIKKLKEEAKEVEAAEAAENAELLGRVQEKWESVADVLIGDKFKPKEGAKEKVVAQSLGRRNKAAVMKLIDVLKVKIDLAPEEEGE